MSPENERLLAQKYVDIFTDIYKSPKESNMAFGIECGDGWFNLLDTLCEEITAYLKGKKTPPVIATQIKEKYGTLRFYYIGGDDYIDTLVEAAEKLSEKICEECGKSGEIYDKGWVYCRCESCAKNLGLKSR